MAFIFTNTFPLSTYTIIELFLLFVPSIILLIYGSIIDIKQKELPDWVSIAIFLQSIIILTYVFILSDFHNMAVLIFSYLFSIFLALIIGLVLFFSNAWGMGDTKLLVALFAILSIFSFITYNIELLRPYFIFPIILSSFFFFYISILLLFFTITILIGAFFGLVFIGVKIFSPYPKLMPSFKTKIKHTKYGKYGKNNKHEKLTLLIGKIGENTNRARFIYVALLFSLFFTILFSYLFSRTLSLVILGTFIISFIASMIFLKAFSFYIEKTLLIKRVPSSKLVEGDWLAAPVKIGKKLLKENKALTSGDINLLKKHKKYVYIKDGIPFVPVLCVSFLTLLLLIFLLG